jgi:DNA-binding transcriptional MerR regulator
LYSQEDINQLTCVKTLINDLGLNAAGVQFALALMSRMDELSKQLDSMSRRVGRLERRKQTGDVTDD